MHKYKIVLVDDHPIVLSGLRQTVDKTEELELLAEISQAEEVLPKVRLLRPDVVVLDISMPQHDGFSLAAILHAEMPALKIIFLTVYREESFLKRALKLGAQGYILKDSPPSEIIAGILTVCQGQPYISTSLTAMLIRNIATPAQHSGIEILTATERTILKMITQYKTTKEIAAAIFVSPRTVEAHRNNMCHKLGLRGSHALTKFATAHIEELESLK